MLAFTIIAAAFAPLALAVPFKSRQSTAPSCVGLGPEAFSDYSNFTLAAVNTTLPNSNEHGAPLMLGDYLSYDGYTEYALATVASYPYGSSSPTLSLVDGGIIANADVSTALNYANSGEQLQFTANYHGTVDPVEVFCGVPANGGYPILAINGRHDQFSLCQRTGGNNFAAVVYNATSGSSSYDYTSCYAVQLFLVPADASA